MKHAILDADGNKMLTYSEEDGKQFIGTHIDTAPAMRHVKNVRDMHDNATRSSNPGGWRHVGTVPIPIIVDWCKRNGYTFDQWARNDGGTEGVTYPDSRSGVKDKFLAYFLSRDFSKLHNEHVTTKRESSQILVPDNYIGSKK